MRMRLVFADGGHAGDKLALLESSGVNSTVIEETTIDRKSKAVS